MVYQIFISKPYYIPFVLPHLELPNLHFYINIQTIKKTITKK